MPRGTKQANKQPVKKVKQIDNGIHRNLDGGHIDCKPLIDLQFNIPKGCIDDKRVKPAEVFEGYKAPSKNINNNKKYTYKKKKK
tara:strand:+ start:148 stop:399 length:252 start_codon:yes stop_codon:yes gene_type:complete